MSGKLLTNLLDGLRRSARYDELRGLVFATPNNVPRLRIAYRLRSL